MSDDDLIRRGDALKLFKLPYQLLAKFEVEALPAVAAPDPAAIREAALREAAKRVTELMTREVKSAVGDGYNLGLGTAYDAILALIQKGADHE